MAQYEATKLNDFLSGLQSAGIEAKQFAAFIKNLIGSDDVVVTGDDNAPGFAYVQRIATASFRALTAHGEEINTAWSEIRRGRYGIGTAMKSWARVVENYYGVVTEVLRSPTQIPLPAWLIIPYSKKDPVLIHSVRVDDILEKDTVLDNTSFEALGSAESDAKNVFESRPTGVGSRVEVVLNEKAVNELPTGTDYVGFIFRGGAGSVPPLAVVVLRILP